MTHLGGQAHLWQKHVMAERWGRSQLQSRCFHFSANPFFCQLLVPHLDQFEQMDFGFSNAAAAYGQNMNERQSDFELLQAFVRDGDQQAFASVVRRHLDLVYATAFRKVQE